MNPESAVGRAARIPKGRGAEGLGARWSGAFSRAAVGRALSRFVGCVLLLAVARPLAGQGFTGDPAFGAADLVSAVLPPDATAFDLAFEADGTAWIASSAGLLRYDGYRVERTTRDDGLPSEFVRAVAIAGDTVWVGTDRGIAFVSGGSAHAFDAPGLPDSPNVRRIRVHPDKSVWFCADSWLTPGRPGGLFVLRDGRVTEREVGDPYVSDVFIASDGTFVVMTLGGFVVGPEGAWRAEPTSSGPSDSVGYAWSAIEDAEGALWVGTNAGIFRRRGSVWERAEGGAGRVTFPRLARPPQGPPIVVESGAGRRLLAWRDGLWRPASGPLPGESITENLVASPDGSVWFVGTAMLVRVPGPDPEWVFHGDVPPPAFEDAQGAVWFSNGTRAVARAAGAWIPVPALSGALFDGGATGVWSVRGSTLTNLAAGTVRTWPVNQLEMASVDRIVADGSGRAVHAFGPDARGVGRHALFGDGGWHPDRTFGFDRGRGFAAVPAADSGAWLLKYRLPLEEGTLFLLTDSVRLQVTAPPVTSFTNQTLRLGADGEPIVVADDHMARLVDRRWELLPNPPARAVSHLGVYAGRAWIAHSGRLGGRSGISRLEPSGWVTESVRNPIWFGPFDAKRPVIIGNGTMYLPDATGEGIVRRVSLPTGVEPTHALLDGRGHVWLRTRGGLLEWTASETPPETEVSASAVRFVAGDTLFARVSGVRRYAASGSEPPDVSWRLDEGPWSRFTATSFLRVATDALAFGRHRLSVRVRSGAGVVDESPAHVVFDVVRTPIEHRWYFLPLVVGMLLLAAAAVFVSTRYVVSARSFNRRLEAAVRRRTADLQAATERVRALSLRLHGVQEEERRVLARELHDEAGSVATTLLLLLRNIRRENGRQGSRLEEAVELTRRLSEMIRFVSFSLRPSILDDFGLEEAVRSLCDRMRSASGIDLQAELALPDRSAFDRHVETAAYRLVQESISNAVRHSGADSVRLELAVDDCRLHIRVRDNGRGLPPPEVLSVRRTAGIAGMRERAELLGGSFAISAAPGGGTLVEATLPMCLDREGAIVSG